MNIAMDFLEEAKNEPVKRVHRATRIDKGKVRLTKRDLFLVGWIGEQYAVRFDQLQILMARNSEKAEGETVSFSNVARSVRKWQSLGLVEWSKPFYGKDNPSWVWSTQEGLRLTNLDFKYQSPSLTMLNHHFWVNRVRLYREAKYADEIWIPERKLRAQNDGRQEHYPDAEVVKNNGSRIAIEVELSRKSVARQGKILDFFETVLLDGIKKFNAIVYYCSEETHEQVSRAMQGRQNFYLRPLTEV